MRLDDVIREPAANDEPQIVRERCHYCRGSGVRALGTGPLAKLDPCRVCAGRGFIAQEAA